MQIILKKEVANLGHQDDVVKVKAGYALNYLIPQGMAILATASALKQHAETVRQRAHKEAKLVEEANALAAAVAAAYVLGIDTDLFEEGIARLEGVLGNYVPIPTDKPYDVAVDSARHHVSYELVLETAKALAKRRLIVACDETVDKQGRRYAKEIANRVVVVGTDKDEVGGVTAAENAQSAALVALRSAKKDDYVLLLGTSYGATQDGTTVAQSIVERITD